MKIFITTTILSLGLLVNTVNAKSIELFVPIQILMQMGIGKDGKLRKNNPSEVTQYLNN